ncbi:MAG: segregation/condensation protein A [Bacillota bacterium]|nr:segregation/condensation protein A [Bacillota bacterium]
MSYEIRLNQFEGPLDLLLHLIKIAEIDIKDIFVSKITEQYIEYMKQLPELDMETASEFIAIAATLIYIKSRSLLPAPPAMGEEEDPRELFIRQLTEYKAYKDICEKMKALEQDAKGTFYKLPEEYISQKPPLDMSSVSAADLYNAMLQVMQRVRDRAGKPPAREIVLQGFTIPEKIARISALLEERGRVCFWGLFENDSSTMEVIVTFLALLEMMHQRMAGAVQEEHLGDIYIVGIKD